MESGNANGPSAYNATEREGMWQDYVKTVPSCASLATSGDVFPCLRNASEEEIKNYVTQPSRFGFAPTLDSGPGSLFPDFATRLYKKGNFARIPFISGTNLDECMHFSLAPAIVFLILPPCTAAQSTRDARSPNYTEADLKKSLFISNPIVSSARLEATIDRILEPYPDVPALGSPHRTGNELFGFQSIYKRAASIRTASISASC